MPGQDLVNVLISHRNTIAPSPAPASASPPVAQRGQRAAGQCRAERGPGAIRAAGTGAVAGSAVLLISAPGTRAGPAAHPLAPTR